ncbi:MAG TPA: hemerythrin family protein [Candidatus Acidoferrum sp.]|nr:hemerythrin family protein [Candidatus Acidoferrum sp.]
MNTFDWNESLRLGISRMDDDHRKIIDCMNELGEVVEAGGKLAEIERSFTRLIDCTRRHFADEERYMQSMNYDRLQPHQMIHRKLLDELEQHFRSFMDSGQVGDNVFRFLRFWLRSHICGIDKQYAQKVRAAA